MLQSRWIYHFDSAGHLTHVFWDGKLIEEYTYNQAGQRVRQWRGKTLHDDPTAGALHYDHQGKLDGYSFPSASSSLLCPFALCGAVKGSPSQNNTLMKMWREPKRHWTACI